ncbi:MAG TPA: tRNA (adenosine(37)-N6)-threonylcarbamoyltransferase complex ATPase subunit type 1 TsaE [Solirubrobacterales bacterium]|nr:tRNA (adenosine(37)-N6)-threonylcarbamoyltransferase complex ATPase subunit type 1 TsaE [Solirubrobacterales bacterium]
MTAERVETASADETEACAGALAARLRPGDVVLLEGEVGAGKTTFVRGAGRRLGVAGPVTSPTFTIGQIYDAEVGSPAVSHLDLYRLGSLADEDPGLLDEYLGRELVTFVEWPPGGPGEIEAELGEVAARVSIEHLGGDRRRITIER